MDDPTPLQSGSLASRHAFFTRLGGVSEGIYAGLNCGYGAKDDTAEAVTENRRRAAVALGAAPDRLVTVHQTHSPDAVTAREPWSPDAAPRADALVTDQPGVMLGILTADCAPVLFEDREAGVVGGAHAGWRGAIGGVLESTLEAMERLGARRERVQAVVGPCIGPEAYEVGPEFVERFVAESVDAARFFGAAASEEAAKAGKRRFDLPAYVAARLRAAGVLRADWIGRCTYAEETLFFSNRRAVHRGEGDYGRLLSAIMVTEQK